MRALPPFFIGLLPAAAGAQPFRRLSLAAGLLLAAAAGAQPFPILDLATVAPEDGVVRRVYGATGEGVYGLPVAGGFDLDGDGFTDYAAGFMLAGDVFYAGQVDLVFGDGTTRGFVDTAALDPRVLHFAGTQMREHIGGEIWIDDVTGDGLGDLLICRQNYTPEAGRIGAGALTVIAGSPALRDLATSFEIVDLGAPPASIAVTTFVGVAELDRLGIWTRTGDVDGDGIADVVVGADQEDGVALGPVETNRGAVYVIRGGAHLAAGGVVDLALPVAPPFAGHVAKITPPAASAGYHFGATCLIADLDGNGRGEVLAAAALNRVGASLPAHGAPSGSAQAVGGAHDGTLYVAWDDNFPAGPWPPGYGFDISASPGSRTVINGESWNVSFSEEIVGGFDVDGDGLPDLFAGDLIADGTATQDRGASGLGHLFYDAAALKGLEFDLQLPPPELRITRILGPQIGALAGDTAAPGDFDGDGLGDLALASPHADPLGRDNAGAVHVLFGRPGGWPALLDLAPDQLPPPETVRVAEIQGALGGVPGDSGDTLGYSAAAGDVDGDGLTDLIVDEMVGNGLSPGTVDVGNLVIVAGRAIAGHTLFADGFESGDAGRWAQ